MARKSLPLAPTLADRFARKVNYLRVSLTDRCNYRCTYCMPDNMVFRQREELLRFEEIERVVRVFVGLGVRRVRLTGGEPTVRAGVVDLVARLAAIETGEGPLALVMTSNGHLLSELAHPLRQAGLREVNISIDTLDPDRFRALTRRGDLARVIAGIDAALAAGLRVKLNAVALKGQHHEDVAALCRFGWARSVTPRFIEHMPMSDGLLYSTEQRLSAAEIRSVISRSFAAELTPVGSGVANGPARYWQLDGDPQRTFGIISAMSEHFCSTCNRLRVSAVGDLHPCLGYDDATSLRDVLRGGGTDDELRSAIEAAVAGKRVGHDFQLSGEGAPSKHMVSIGG